MHNVSFIYSRISVSPKSCVGVVLVILCSSSGLTLWSAINCRYCRIDSSHGGIAGLPQSVDRIVLSAPSFRMASRLRSALLTHRPFFQRLHKAAFQNNIVIHYQFLFCISRLISTTQYSGWVITIFRTPTLRALSTTHRISSGEICPVARTAS